MAETASHNRYGLSLEELEQQRVIHTVGLLREGLSSDNAEYQSEYYGQAADLEASHISEVLAGETRTKFEFESRDGRLYALQPEGITDWSLLHKNGYMRAKLMAQRDPAFHFYEEIAHTEHEEAQIQEQMVRGGQPATLVTVSLCGNDVASSDSLRLIGRDPELQRGYLRTSVYDGEKLHLYSYSRDRLTVEGAKKIFEDLGVDLPEDVNSIDILRTRVSIDGAHHDLLDRIVPLQDKDAYKFVLSQPDLLKVHMDELESLALRDLPPAELAYRINNLRYNVMASFKRRLEGKWIELGDIGDSVSYAGSIERAAGTQFAGCDVIITSTTNNLAETGYVNAALGLKESWIWKDGICQIKECPSRKPKPRKVKVGPCSVCKNCQNLFDNNKNPAKEYKRVEKRQKPSSWDWRA